MYVPYVLLKTINTNTSSYIVFGSAPNLSELQLIRLRFTLKLIKFKFSDRPSLQLISIKNLRGKPKNLKISTFV